MRVETVHDDPENGTPLRSDILSSNEMFLMSFCRCSQRNAIPSVAEFGETNVVAHIPLANSILIERLLLAESDTSEGFVAVHDW